MKGESSEMLPKAFCSPQLEVLKVVGFFFALCFDLVLVLNTEVVEMEQLKSTQRCFLSNVMCYNTRWHSRT